MGEGGSGVDDGGEGDEAGGASTSVTANFWPPWQCELIEHAKYAGSEDGSVTSSGEVDPSSVPPEKSQLSNAARLAIW
jgi:hypothetical protein